MLDIRCDGTLSFFKETTCCLSVCVSLRNRSRRSRGKLSQAAADDESLCCRGGAPDGGTDEGVPPIEAEGPGPVLGDQAADMMSSMSGNESY
eukprot:CAMPEP_0172921620 /NCGR_PEP_ID=MMETSP1075-20121228/206289_1 /TAXON_ID=2916 /ORGANISM="Ceratium fusus, Strain PA161109" /LENGTH=91 /DNA_ID=CAMNT_0013781817 /DNA_START=502 /DNA_END=774 /DNA_ORIENTATION=+